MKNRVAKLLSISILAASIFSFGYQCEKNQAVESVAEHSLTRSYTNHDGDTYYNSINSSSSSLLSDLQTLNASKLKTRVGYDNMLKSGGPMTFTDPGTSSGQVTAFYAGKSASISSCNKEHTWPASRTVLGRDKDPLEDDIHMVRPTLSADNSSRGNEFYVEGRHGPAKPYKETGYDPGAFDANDATYRGDSARIIFYCAVADSALRIIDEETDSQSNHTMGKLSDLLKWNLEYPVKEREEIRNEEAEKLQGNRNPFIDHPSYACRIWGLTNNATKAICAGHMDDDEGTGGGGTTTTVPTVDIYRNTPSGDTKVEDSTIEINIGDSFNLVAYVNGVKSEQCSWEFDGDSVIANYATGNGRSIYGVEPGTTVLTVGKSYNDASGAKQTATKQLTIRVVDSSTGGGGTSTGQTETTSYTFTNQKWNASPENWTSGQDGLGFLNGGVQVTKGGSGANATSPKSFNKVKKVIVKYCTNGSGGAGNIIIDVGTTNLGSFTVTKEGGTTQRNAEITGNTALNGKVKITVECSTNSIYICGIDVICETQSTPPVVEKTLTGLTTTGSCKTSYEDGEAFNPNGLTVTANYSDGSSKDVTEEIQWSVSTLSIGMTTVIGLYENKTIVINVTVAGEVPPIIDDDDDDGGNTEGDDDTGGDDDDDDDIEPIAPLPSIGLGGGLGMGCMGDVTTSSLIVTIFSLLGVLGIIFLKRRKEN